MVAASVDASLSLSTNIRFVKYDSTYSPRRPPRRRSARNLPEQLPEEQEHLRDTLFSALYGSMVMFDTHDNAHAYQVRCKRAGSMSLPILVEEDGASLVSDGY